MKKPKPQKLYVWRVTVRIDRAARGCIPLDMMRYDRCCPETEVDAGKLNRLVHTHSGGELTEADRTVSFKMYDIAGQGPHAARWRSFGCEILSVEPLEP